MKELQLGAPGTASGKPCCEGKLCGTVKAALSRAEQERRVWGMRGKVGGIRQKLTCLVQEM